MKTRKRKKRLRIFPFFLVMVAIFLAAVLYMVNNPAGMIPDRDSALAEGRIANDDMFYILLVGSDQHELRPGSSRADTIIVASIDLTNNDVFLLSIPRDSYVNIPGYGYDKINHAYSYGEIELLQETVEELLNIPIDQYAMIDFTGFEEIIDVLGGVEIDVDKRMYHQTYDGVIDIQAGLQTLDGEQALQYVRYRADVMGDITRVSRQQILLKAIFDEFGEDNGYLKLPQLIPAINAVIESDINTVDMLRLAVFGMNMDGENVESMTLPGDFITKDGLSYWQISDSQKMDIIATYF